MSQRGDTLVEVTIALAIISSVIVSTYAVANRAYSSGVTARQRTEATALLQQQAEILRNRRDNNLLAGAAGWDTFRSGLFGSLFAGPLCSAGSAGVPLHLTLSPGTGSNVWTANGSATTIAATGATYTVTNLGCYTDSTKNTLRFTMTAAWTDSAGDQSAELSTQLANVGDIKQLAPSF